MCYTKVVDHQLLTAPQVVSCDLPPALQDVDADGSGVIDYTEFLAATLDRLMGSPWVASVINRGWLENPRTELGFEYV